MIVYRDQRVQADTFGLLSALRSNLTRVGLGGTAGHDAVGRVLIGMGTLESGVDDAIFPEADGLDLIGRRLRETSAALGHAFWHTWHEQPREAERWLELSTALLGHLALQRLPSTIQISVPEGYAYYAVYPEMYLEAARRCHAALGRFDAVCLGLRSIGASLSATVTGALEELGCRVLSHTLRPRGHPFGRRPVLTAELEASFLAQRNSHFLLVDEGPGISGSSLAGTAQMLSEIGVSDDRIILFPSWETDGSTLQSEVARERWPRHRRFVASFEEIWIESERLSSALPTGQLHDVSAGLWRDHVYPDLESYPAVQPQHERRKYLLQLAATGKDPGSFLLSFAGLGEGVEAKVRRAEVLAHAEFMPAPERAVHGFLVRRFIPGTPVSTDRVDSTLIETMASYLAYLFQEHPAQPSVTGSSLTEMITTNVREGLGDEWLPQLEVRLSGSLTAWCEHPVALDGRMLPHEWVETASGYMKVDALDHHDDHFFPGCQDIAWDVAAACLEFGLDAGAQRWLVQRYRALSHDRTITERLPRHAITYLAFRLGYASLASSTLGDTPDGRRFVTAAERYRRLLRRELSQPPDRWDA
jgi:hypothetical protein